MAEEPASFPPSLPPTTTAQQDITTAGQRKINLIWEYTQAIIAIFVVVSTLGTAMYMEIAGKVEQIPTIFSTAFGMIVGFYFARTNHQAIGGIGKKPRQKYEGR
jgi:hypothetical protein